MYVIRYRLNGSDQQLIATKADIAAQLIQDIARKGAVDVVLSGPKTTELDALRCAVRSMGLNEQLQLIEDFKSYIKML